MNGKTTLIGYAEPPLTGSHGSPDHPPASKSSSGNIPTLVVDLRTLSLMASEPSPAAPPLAETDRTPSPARDSLPAAEDAFERGLTKVWRRGELPTIEAPLERPARPAVRTRAQAGRSVAALLGIVLTLGLVGYRSFSRTERAHARSEQRGSAEAATRSAPSAAKRAAPEPVSQGVSIPAERSVHRPADASPQDGDRELSIPAEPEQAARSFALGEYSLALGQYRFLAQREPHNGAYALMVKVLQSRTSDLRAVTP